MINTTFFGDCNDGLEMFAQNGILAQTCVTSPPYYGLRDYGIPAQMGREDTLAEYIRNMTNVFSKVWRVLADNGTLWLNIGDSYAGGDSREFMPKNLMGVPWRLAFALQDSGWILRQDIIWSKTNGMPESVTDRCTRSHEYLFLFTKSQKYIFNTIKEESKPESQARAKRGVSGQNKMSNGIPGQKLHACHVARPIDATREVSTTRNRRSVWEMPTAQSKDNHFAVMPLEMAELCIAAGSNAGDLVLDPFMGSGTVAQAAQNLGRRWVGCEINPAYKGIQVTKTRQPGLAL